MASPKTGIESLRRSWAATPSRSPHKPGPSDMQIDERPPPSPQMRVRASPRSVSPSRPRGHSPSPSSRGNAEPKDPNTEIVQTLREMDARCSLVVNGNVWIGEREGSISIKNADGATIHIIEKRKGAFVWSLVQVGNNVWAGCSDGFIRVLSSTTYKMERQFARHAGGGGGVQALAFHRPSNTVFSGSNDFEILAWDATSTDFLRQLSAQSGVRALVADTHVLYSGTDDGSVSVWDILTGERIQQWTGHSKAVLSLTQTEKYVWSGSEDATIRIWNPTNGECIGVAEVHTGSVGVLTSVGNKVWSGAGDTVCLWDAERLELLGTYVAHEGYIDNITVIGKAAIYKVWTSATDKNLKVWKSEIIPDETDELKRKLAHQQQVEYENRVLKEQIAQKDKALELAAQRQRELEAELDRRKTVDMENAELRKAIAERDDTIALLRNQLDDSERRNARLTEDVATLGRLLDELKLENAKLRADLDRTIHEKLLVEQKLQETIIAAEAKLQETIASYESKLKSLTDSYESKLRITIDSYEAKLRDTIRAAEDKLAATVQSYESKLAATIQSYEAKLLETIQSYEAKLRDAEDKLADTIARYEEKVALLTAQLNEANEQARFLRGELEKAKAENAHLNDELRKAWADIDAMSLKLKEMDTIFKSRLSLITDVFRTFKRYEQADRKLRATTGEGRDAFVVAMSEFKTTIANHFTDDELAHLGSSRHFFPVEPRIGSPATTRARSPAP